MNLYIILYLLRYADIVTSKKKNDNLIEFLR